MMRFKKLKPAFWDHQEISGDQAYTTFNFRRKWILLVLFTSFMALLPLLIMTLMDFSITRKTIENEVKKSMSKTLDAAVASFSFSLNRGKNFPADTPAKEKEHLAALYDLVASLAPGGDEDIFVIKEDGTLLTPSFYYGSPGLSLAFMPGLFNKKSGFATIQTPGEKAAIAGYCIIPDLSFTLVMVKSKKGITDLWLRPRLQLVGYLSVSIVLILLSILGTSTYLVGRIHAANRKRIEALHHAEHAKKLASIGRLASGVAHEINNPLAIINQKTGLILDLFTLKKEFYSDERLIPLANHVLDAVKRCGTITRRLLDFARHMEPSIEPVNVKEVIDQVLAFLEKEAQRRSIAIDLDIQTNVPLFECDKGSLQQIFLNLVENAFAAMEDGGQLAISVKLKTKEKLILIFSDNGCGISEEDVAKIFEPFHSSKNNQWGTGLGLSITYGLVKELEGDIMVKSRIGKGSRFILTLPLKPVKIEN